MTPQERELVTQLLQRLRQAGGGEPKDPEADSLIRRAVAEQPDAPYYLVQTVLMQDMALAEAQRRIEALERQAPSSATPQRSFLGGSVPSAGPWARVPQPAPAAPVWGTQAAAAPAPQVQPSASSGFLRSAAATAAGIAGGALLFEGIRSMFGHGFGGPGLTQQPGIGEAVINQEKEQAAWDDQAADDGTPDQDVAADDWSGGGDDSDLV